MYDFLKDKTILYIEDEKDVLYNTSELLSGYVKHFYTALTADEGYEILNKEIVDILLIDIELPKTNGLDFIKTIREVNNTIPIVIISAYTKTEYLLDSIELNLIQYIVKPLNSKKIKTLFEKLNNYFIDEKSYELSKGVFLDISEATLSYNSTVFELTKREVKFLLVIAKKNIIYYHELNKLWDTEIPTENAVRSFVKYLRKKLPKDLLKNRNGYGYYIST